MNQEQILSILYELAMLVGAETRVEPLLNKTLQKLMFHTGFPCGIFVTITKEVTPPSSDNSSEKQLWVKLDAVVGNYELSQRIGDTLELPKDYVEGATQLIQDEFRIGKLCPETQRYQYMLKLPVRQDSAFLLFSANPPKNNLPLEQLFEPFLNNFAKSLKLCRVNESYTARLVEEREHAYSDLRRFRAALDTTDDCMFIIDPVPMKFIDFNKSAVTALKYTEQELLQMGPQHVMCELSLPEWRTIANRAINEKKEITEITTTQRRADHETYPVEVRISAFKKDKQPLLIAVSRNVTVRKIAEEELNAYKDQLEVLVAERTKELQISNRELESYSYSIAHDLRSPLRSMIGFNQIVLEDAAAKLDHEEIQFLNKAVEAGHKMEHLIDELLELSRLSRAKINTKKVDLSKVSSEIVEMLRLTNKSRDVDIIVEQGLSVDADPELLWLCMENLIGNAWKYTKKKLKAKIEIGRCKAKFPEIYYVRDNGAGFNMKYKEKLFQPFQRLHNDKEFDGTGIGLASVQRIITRHGGNIWADAKEGGGATFYFTLKDAAQNVENGSTPVIVC